MKFSKVFMLLLVVIAVAVLACGTVAYAAETTPCTEHSYGEVVGVEKDGKWYAVKACSVCGHQEYLNDGKPIEVPTGAKAIESKDSTCVKAGYDTYEVAVDGGGKIVQIKVTIKRPLAYHQYANGVEITPEEKAKVHALAGVENPFGIKMFMGNKILCSGKIDEPNGGVICPNCNIIVSLKVSAPHAWGTSPEGETVRTTAQVTEKYCLICKAWKEDETAVVKPDGGKEQPTPSGDEQPTKPNAGATQPTPSAGEDEPKPTPTQPSEDEKGDEPPKTNEQKVQDWQTLWNEVIAPCAVFAISGISAIYVLVLPVITKARRATDKFNSATDNVNTSNKNAKQAYADAKQMMTDTKKEIAEFKTLISTQYADLNNRINKIEVASKNTEKISRIGFSNINELVTKGYAAEIGKVGNNEQDEEETTKS